MPVAIADNARMPPPRAGFVEPLRFWKKPAYPSGLVETPSHAIKTRAAISRNAAALVRLRGDAHHPVRPGELAARRITGEGEQGRRRPCSQPPDGGAARGIDARPGVAEMTGISVPRCCLAVKSVVRTRRAVALARTPTRPTDCPHTPTPPAVPNTPTEPAAVDWLTTWSCCTLVFPCSSVRALTVFVCPRLNTPPTPLPATAAVTVRRMPAQIRRWRLKRFPSMVSPQG